MSVSFKTTFSIAKMDCPSEERMIRMGLEGMTDIQSLHFDIPGRRLEVYHTGAWRPIFDALDALRLDTTFVASAEEDVTMEDDNQRQQRRVLRQVLGINLFLFILEMFAGFLAGSMGLVADSLDMLADSIVYGLSLVAVGGTAARKKRIAGAAGYFQLFLALLGFAEVIRRFSGRGETPDFLSMIVISFLALLGNAACLYLLQISKSREAHMQASVIFTSNDVIVNLGVITAGILVYITASNLPDLIVGTLVFILVVRGAYRILRLSRR